MSASLLQKSLRLLEDKDSINKGPRKVGLSSSKRKKQRGAKKTVVVKEDNIKNNLAKLKLLSSQAAIEVSKLVFESSKDKIEIEKVEETSAFTDKDFEEFEKEYFVS